MASDYSESVKELAAQVIKGEKSIETLDAVVSHFDQAAEKEKSEAAAKETTETKETAPQQVTDKSENDGTISDDESHKSAVERIKKQK